MNFKVPRFQMALEQILKDVSTKISNVGAAVNCRPASIDVDFLILARCELFNLPRISIEKAQSH
jgi:hypothetical protein